MQKISTKNYKNFLQYFIKKGNKAKMETIFKKGFLFWIKNLNQQNFDSTLKTAFINTTPVVGVKTARKGSKNIYVPTRLTSRRGKFLSAKWMSSNILAKKKNKIYESIVEELIESSSKKSTSAKKRDELHKLAEENLVNFK
jgi:small subunit ribosomal protein S7